MGRNTIMGWGRLSKAAIAAVMLGYAGTASAQSGVETSAAAVPLPAPPEPGSIPLAAFASRASLQEARLSPDGALFAYKTTFAGKKLLAIVDADTREPVQSIALDSVGSVNWYSWAGPRKVLISVGGNAVGRYWQGYYTRLFVYDLDDRKLRYIGFKDQALEGDDVLYTDPQGGFVLLSASHAVGRNPDVWRFPLDASGEKGAVKVQERQDGIEEWWADDAGVVRLGMNFTEGGSTIIHYRSGPAEPFRRIAKLGKEADELENWGIMGIFQGSDTGYAMVGGDNGRQILRQVDYTTGALGEIVYENPDWSLERVVSARGRGPIGIEYIDDAPRTHWLDPGMAKHQRNLETALGGGFVKIISRTDDGNRMLVLHSGPADPGAVYVYTPAAKRLDLYANLRPGIDERALASPAPFRFTARDGVEMRGYLTLPRGLAGGAAGRNLPTIVMPHGGPYGVRDSLEYNDWVQLLASRGYAVLQVNFRGSGGYGTAFEELGDGQIGRRMQDDLDDALDWAVAQGHTDPARVCLVGASYGGYAALWGVTRNPERYRCAASFAGVTDWQDLLAYDRNYLGRDFYRRVWKDKVTGEKDFELSEVSPVDQIARLQRPVLLVHGKEDERVPFKHFTNMVSAARKADKTVQALELDDDHHLSKEENELLFYETLLGFLAEHNPVAPAGAGS